MARACIALNSRCRPVSVDLEFATDEIFHVGKDEAIAALKRSVVLDNPSDWQLLVELTSNSD